MSVRSVSSPPDVRILSCGAGVDSSTLALLMRDGKLPLVDHVVFADVGWELPEVYEQWERLCDVFTELGIPAHVVSNGDLRRDALDPNHRFASIPYFIRNADGSRGIGRRQCTAEYKITPIHRKVRELLGATPPRFRRVPSGRLAEVWIGFSASELGRVNPYHSPSYMRQRYPLIELGLTRRDCESYLRRSGWTGTQKSSCIGCPFHGNRQWRFLRDHRPDAWADAVTFDHAIRRGGARGIPLTGQAFLHASRLPLDEAPIDHWTRGDTAAATAARQTDLLDLLLNPASTGDGPARDVVGDEDDEPDGCSPFGCRSGPVIR